MFLLVKNIRYRYVTIFFWSWCGSHSYIGRWNRALAGILFGSQQQLAYIGQRNVRSYNRSRTSRPLRFKRRSHELYFWAHINEGKRAINKEIAGPTWCQQEIAIKRILFLLCPKANQACDRQLFFCPLASGNFNHPNLVIVELCLHWRRWLPLSPRWLSRQFTSSCFRIWESSSEQNQTRAIRKYFPA